MKRKAPAEVERLLGEAQKVFDTNVQSYPQDRRMVFYTAMLVALCTSMRVKRAMAFWEEMTTVQKVRIDAFVAAHTLPPHTPGFVAADAERTRLPGGYNDVHPVPQVGCGAGVGR